ncbi:MAG: alpha/beta fold hydrolase [Myxococcota bacterium]|nr:alpha/beta fold hydrolase [Myxococcota bacterium]
MPSTTANGITLEYESFGEAGARPLLLLRGLGTQMIQWDRTFCQQIADAGHRLVIFDNRDVGLSTHFHDARVPSMEELVNALAGGETPEVPYCVDDMAGDVVGLMDALGFESAHIAGISMGGMIVQQCAIRYPERVRSMTSIMSSTSEPGLPGPSPEAQAALTEAAPSEREAYIEYSVRTGRVFTGNGFPYDAEGRRELAGRVYDRAFDPPGIARQMAAVVASGSRAEGLAALTVPSLVVHGSSDPLIPLAAGLATADTIPGAEMVVIDGMGHDLPPGAWAPIVEALARHTERSEAG